MARPAPTVLLHHETRSLWLDVLAAPKPCVVLYRGLPFSVRCETANSKSGAKYLKTSFPNTGHAIRLANRLNTMFNTTDFTVSEL